MPTPWCAPLAGARSGDPYGQYKGNIVVKNRAELAKGARVVGNITCQGLVVAEGAWFEGQLSMGKPPEARAPGRS
jgi:cytoskeletal protein CcmA (bactofilin family)